MKKHLFSLLQRIGQSFMLPIALLPIAGIFLGIGSSLTNTNMLAAYHLKGLMGPGTAPYILFSLLNSAGSIIFDNLPILFAVGVGAKKPQPHFQVLLLSLLCTVPSEV